MCFMAVITRTQAGTSLGGVLETVRKARGISQRGLAKMIGKNSALISMIESGKRAATPDVVAAILDALEVEPEQADEIRNLAAAAGQTGQWVATTIPERRQQLAALLAAETKATKVTHMAALRVPGVLQTTEVIRAIMVQSGVPVDEIDERVMLRIGRRDLITRPNPAQLEVLLGEAAIRYVIGGPEVWTRQLRYLNEMGELPNVTLRAVPYSAGNTPLLDGPFILLESEVGQEIVSLDLHRSGLMLQDREDIAAHRQAVEVTRAKAMSPAETAGLIAKVQSELEQE